MSKIILKPSLKQDQMLKKMKRLKLDPVVLLGVSKKIDLWKTVRGILGKKPTGLGLQKLVRKEWL